MAARGGNGVPERVQDGDDDAVRLYQLLDADCAYELYGVQNNADLEKLRLRSSGVVGRVVCPLHGDAHAQEEGGLLCLLQTRKCEIDFSVLFDASFDPVEVF